MNLDDMKSCVRNMKAGLRPDAAVAGAAAFDGLVARLKAMEAEEQCRLRKARVLYIIAAALFAFTFLVACLVPNERTYASQILQYGMLLIIFVCLTMALRRRIVQLSRIDYAQPVKGFLHDALQRHALLPATPAGYVIQALGLIALGMSGGYLVFDIYITRWIEPAYYPLAMVVYTLLYLGLVMMGIYFTRKNWQRDKGALCDEIRDMLAALDDETFPAAEGGTSY